MGWKGNTITPGRVFGSVVDTLIRQAPCDVVLVKFGEASEGLGDRRQEGDKIFNSSSPPAQESSRKLPPSSSIAG